MHEPRDAPGESQGRDRGHGVIEINHISDPAMGSSSLRPLQRPQSRSGAPRTQPPSSHLPSLLALGSLTPRDPDPRWWELTEFLGDLTHLTPAHSALNSAPTPTRCARSDRAGVTASSPMPLEYAGEWYALGRGERSGSACASARCERGERAAARSFQAGGQARAGRQEGGRQGDRQAGREGGMVGAASQESRLREPAGVTEAAACARAGWLTLSLPASFKQHARELIPFPYPPSTPLHFPLAFSPLLHITPPPPGPDSYREPWCKLVIIIFSLENHI